MILGTFHPWVVGGPVIIPNGDQRMPGVHRKGARVRLVLRVTHAVIIERDNFVPWLVHASNTPASRATVAAPCAMFVDVIAEMHHEIDLVVIGKRGNRVAIQCDGDREITREALEAGLHKQMTLERLGWRFIRVRGSEYLRHPHETMRKIRKSLKKFEIQPMDPLDARSNGKNNGKGGKDEEDLQSSDLHQRILQRAESIRSRWKDIPSVSSIFKHG